MVLLNSFRFSPTRPPVHWSGIRSALVHAPSCPQAFPNIANTTAALRRMPRRRLEYLRNVRHSLENQSEDCLHLNIYAPFVESSTGSSRARSRKKNQGKKLEHGALSSSFRDDMWWYILCSAHHGSTGGSISYRSLPHLPFKPDNRNISLVQNPWFMTTLVLGLILNVETSSSESGFKGCRKKRGSSTIGKESSHSSRLFQIVPHIVG